MNALEHKRRIAQAIQAKRLTGKSGEIVFPEFDWNSLQREPIQRYVSNQVIYDMDEIVSSVKLMNNPTKKYRYMSEILKPYGFRHLASGTNRRSYYCTQDEGIILKIGSDKIGKQDNLSEYGWQNLMKPFCNKVFNVIPSGVMSLIERGEEMTEEEYKTIWASDIFDFTFQIFQRGYIMEDIGANFFKNWVIRLGFGPILCDFPYIYEVDWTRFKCVKKDPITGIHCDGSLDYDYSRGMSEIVCQKCGTRYSARYLAKSQNGYFVSQAKKGERNMFSNYYTPLFSIKIGNNRYPVNFKEENYRKDETVQQNIIASVKNVPQYNNTKKKKFVPRQNENKPVEEKKPEYVTYDRELKSYIIGFLKRVEDRFDSDTAIDLGNKLGIKYYARNNNTQPKKEETVVKEEVHTTKQDWKVRDDSINNLDEATTNFTSSVEEVVEPENKESDRFNLKIDKKEETVASNSTNDADKPTTGLFPINAMSKDELLSTKINDEDPDLYGFPGIPQVDTMRINQMAPIIRKKVEDMYNNFNVDSDFEITDICDSLSETIKNFIYDDVKKLVPDLANDLEVTATYGTDASNKGCYEINVEVRGTFIFSTILYKYEEDDNGEDYNAIVSNQGVLINFLNTNIANFDDSKYDDSIESKSQKRKDMINYLYNALENTKKNKVKCGDTKDPVIISKLTEFIDAMFTFPKKVIEKDINIGNEL